jgi:hypothetical protein
MLPLGSIQENGSRLPTGIRWEACTPTTGRDRSPTGTGEGRLIADPKAAEVYINGGYAGTADKLKTLWLDPGAYDLTVSAAGRQPFHQRLYVLSGKSLKITAKLSAEAAKETP